jgi:hypothetical protein
MSDNATLSILLSTDVKSATSAEENEDNEISRGISITN